VARKIVWVELSGGNVSRIFRSQKLAFANCEDPQAVFKDEAVGAIRRQVYDRQSGRCLWCDEKVKWDGGVFERAHMHEQIPKGRGGEVSITNSIILCPKCHLSGAHGNRQPRFGENG
jgi:HNH endonuclease